MTSDPDIFIAPCSRDNNKSAIRYLRETVIDGISPEEYPAIKQIGYDEKTPVWGVVESKRSTWEKMREGVDIVLFYSKSGYYTHLAVIEKKYENADLANEVWDPYDGSGVTTDPDDAWSLMFFLKNVEKVDIPAKAVHDAFDYTMDYPLGFLRPTDERHSKCRSKYGSVLKFLNHVSNQEEFDGISISDTISNGNPNESFKSIRRKRSKRDNDITDNDSSTIHFEQDVEDIQEKSQEHEHILDIFEENITQKGFNAFETINSDLIGIRDDEIILAEAKTIANNEDVQIRKAIGQLYEYRYRDIQLDNGLNDNPLLCLILDQKPTDFYFGFLSRLQEEGIYLYWIKDGKIMGPKKSKDTLENL